MWRCENVEMWRCGKCGDVVNVEMWEMWSRWLSGCEKFGKCAEVEI
jgi:hypothetical protein